MSKALVIVESPTKAKYIYKILNKGESKAGSNFLKEGLGFERTHYDVVATCGHIVDLPEDSFGIYYDSQEKSYFLNFVWRDERYKRLIGKLKRMVKGYDYIYLATDPDREGEAISYHLYQELSSVFPSDRIYRIRLYAITESEIFRAISKREKIDLNLVRAQFTRRAIDRIIGYVLSPYYSRLLRQTVSVGRVQTLALYFITKRFREFRDFVPDVFYYFQGSFYPTYVAGRDYVFVAKGSSFSKEEKAIAKRGALVLQGTRGYKITKKVIRRETINPPLPLTTASLQKVAFRRYGFSSDKTMRLAQSLYEKGHCSYIRTDSVNVSQEGYLLAKEFIDRHYGFQYFNDRPVFFNENFEEEREKRYAHECIRPLHFGVPNDLSDDEQRLFYLIKSYFIASHMKPAIVERVEVEVLPYYFDALYVSDCEKFLKDERVKKVVTFTAEGSRIIFDGFLKVIRDEFRPENSHLFVLQEGQGLNGLISLKKKKTQPPSLMTQEEVIDMLEKSKVGRPSTYSVILKTLYDRGYIKGSKKIVPTNLAEAIISQVERKEMNGKFRKSGGILIDVDFTAKMEKDLDEISCGRLEPDVVIKSLEDRIKDVYPIKFVVPVKKMEREVEKEVEDRLEGKLESKLEGKLELSKKSFMKVSSLESSGRFMVRL